MSSAQASLTQRAETWRRNGTMDLRLAGAEPPRIRVEESPQPIAERLWRAAEAAGLPVLARSKEQAFASKEYTLTPTCLMTWHDDQVAGLVSGLASGSAADRVARIEALQELGDDRLTPLFVSLAAGAAEVDVRVAAIDALSEDSSPESVQALVAALGDPDPWIVENARAALIWLGPGIAYEPLKHAMRHGPASTRAEARDLVERVFDIETPE